MPLLTGTQYTVVPEERHNAIINSNFDVWQRGTSFVGILDDYTADRFMVLQGTTGAITATRSTDVPTYAESGASSLYSLKLDVTAVDAALAAGVYAGVRYVVEGHDLRRLWGRTVTFSFWMKTNKTGTYAMAFNAGAADSCYVHEFTIDTANTWEKKSMTLTLDDTIGTWSYDDDYGLRIYISIGTGTDYQTATLDQWVAGNDFSTANVVNGMDSTSNEFRFAQFQLETGTEATELVPYGYQKELAKCQRYYERTESITGANYQRFGTGHQTSTTVANVLIPYRVPKRNVTPTLDIPAVGNFAWYHLAAVRGISSLTINQYNTHALDIIISGWGAAGGAGDAGHLIANNTTAAYFGINAEFA